MVVVLVGISMESDCRVASPHCHRSYDVLTTVKIEKKAKSSTEPKPDYWKKPMDFDFDNVEEVQWMDRWEVIRAKAHPYRQVRRYVD
jgi:hypothetical protein